MNLALISISTYALNFPQTLSKLAETQRKPVANNANQDLVVKLSMDANSKSTQLTKKCVTAHFEERAKKSTVQNMFTSSEAASPARSHGGGSQIEKDYEPLLHYLPENNL